MSGRRGRTFDDIHTLKADNIGGRAFFQPEGLFELDCKVRVADDGSERLPFQNCCVRLSGAFKGAEPLNYPVAT